MDEVLGVSRWATLEGEDDLGVFRCVEGVLGVSCWVDEVLGLSRWATLEGEDDLGVFCCVEEVLGVSCWVDEVLGVSRWAIRWGEEAREVSSCVEAVWATSLWAERWREEAWGVALRGLLCGVVGGAGVSANRCRSKEKYPLSPRSFAQCCPALRFPPPEPRERRGRFKVRAEV